MSEDFYSGDNCSGKGVSSGDEYDFELSVSNEKALTNEKDGKRLISVCTGVPSQNKFGKTFSAFEKKPQHRRPRSSPARPSQAENESTLGEADEAVEATQKAESYTGLAETEELSREPTSVLEAQPSTPKRKRKSLENTKKALRTPSDKSGDRQKRKSSRLSQSPSASSLANLSWDNESDDGGKREDEEVLLIVKNGNSGERVELSVENAKPVNPSTYMETVEMASMSQTVDDLTYAFDGFDNISVRNDCCVQILELCCQNSESIGLIFRSKNFFVKLFDSVKLADNSIFEFGLVSVFFVLLSGDNQSSNSYYFNDDRPIQLMVKVLSRQDVQSKSHGSSHTDSAHTLQPPASKRRRSSLLSVIRSSSATSVSQDKKDIDPNVTEIRKLLSVFPAFEELPLDKITPKCVAVECLSILSASLVNRHVKSEFVRLGVNNAIESVFLICSSMNWAAKPWDAKLLESCMSFVENASYMNKENQDDLVQSGKLVPAVVNVFKAAIKSKDMMEYTALHAMKALINLVEKGEAAAKQCVETGIFNVLTGELSTFVAKGMFDLSVLTVVLLANLTEADRDNRIAVCQCCDFIQTLVSVYRKADVFSDGNEGQVFSAYCAILFGCLAKDVPENAEAIVQNGVSFDELSSRVTEFVAFQSSAGILSTQARDSYLEIVETFQKLDLVYKPK